MVFTPLILHTLHERVNFVPLLAINFLPFCLCEGAIPRKKEFLKISNSNINHQMMFRFKYSKAKKNSFKVLSPEIDVKDNPAYLEGLP